MLRSRALLGLLPALLVLPGCGSDESATAAEASDRPVPRTVAEATLLPGDPVPAPTGKVVLVVKDAGNPNVGDDLQLDMALLDRLGAVEMTVDDRQALGREATFTGPLVETLLDVADVDGETMHTVALNDYAVDVPVQDARELPLVLATRVEGETMSAADYGPTRFVYPTEGYDLDRTVYDARWIWQLKEISVS